MTLLSATGLSKSFGGITALKGFGLQLTPGAIYGIIGPNGAGKTTLFSILTGFLKADTGTVSLRGREVQGLNAHDRARLGLARTFQIVKPFIGMTALQTIQIALWGCQCRHRDKSPAQTSAWATELLARVNLLPKRDVLVDLLNPGELRLLDIARALATDPDVLFLDEPFAGLGHNEIRLLSELFVERRQAKKTVVIVEHRLRELMPLVDDVIVMNFGERLASGTPHQISANKAVIDAYLGTQTDSLAPRPLDNPSHA